MPVRRSSLAALFASLAITSSLSAATACGGATAGATVATDPAPDPPPDPPPDSTPARPATGLATGPDTYACTCQRACTKLQQDGDGSCYGDCAHAPDACRTYFDCILAGGGPACTFGDCAVDGSCDCGRWYHGGGACVQDFTPPPTGDCPDRCGPTGPTCRPGTTLADGRCQEPDGG
jgi:hypothetical protein